MGERKSVKGEGEDEDEGSTGKRKGPREKREKEYRK